MLGIKKLEHKIDSILKILSYKRVPGFDRENFNLHDYVSAILRASILHQKAFGDKRFKNMGQDVVVTATGPSFQYYKPIAGAFHIGVNTAFRNPNIEYKALFCQDPRCFGTEKISEDFIRYHNDKCEKYIGNSCAYSVNENLEKYCVCNYMSENKFNYFIVIAPLPDFCCVIFSAFSYALWTHPRRIFLVGADCTLGHAAITNNQIHENCAHLVKPWKDMAEFVKSYYEDIEIISVNPVGLKGLFKDVYTREFLADHPDIDRHSVEILD